MQVPICTHPLTHEMSPCARTAHLLKWQKDLVVKHYIGVWLLCGACCIVVFRAGADRTFALPSWRTKAEQPPLIGSWTKTQKSRPYQTNSAGACRNDSLKATLRRGNLFSDRKVGPSPNADDPIRFPALQSLLGTVHIVCLQQT